MGDCVFCKIAEKEIPSNIVYEDDQIICFHDLEPQAPVHVLIIPKKHIASMDDVSADDRQLMGYIMTKVKEIAEILGLENGYRPNRKTSAFSPAWKAENDLASGLRQQALYQKSLA